MILILFARTSMLRMQGAQHCDQLAAMDSASTPKATPPMTLQNCSIPNPRNQARSANLGGGADSDSKYEDINAEDVGATTP